MKRCVGCGNQFKPRDKQINYCLVCAPTQNDRCLMKMYGINLAQCNVMLEQQDHACALCRRLFSEIPHSKRRSRAWVVDHCHVSEVVRGLLCQGCNQILGYLESKGGVEWAKRAITYLERGRK